MDTWPEDCATLSQLRCPSCRRPLEPGLRCGQGHQFAITNQVLALLGDEFGRELHAFLARLEPIRASEQRLLLDPAAYERLPAGQRHHEWRLRRYGLAAVRRLLRDGGRRRILDIGAWNGWLSHRLACDGHDVTGIDYFADPHDGLGARIHYPTPWRAIQMDLLDLAILGQQYGAVIINHCLQFMPDPLAYVRAARACVAPGGLLIIIGMQIFRDPRPKAASMAALLQRHRERHGFELLLRPTRGYLDASDMRGLEQAGIALRRYPQAWPANLKAALRPALPLHCYGVGGSD